MRILALEPYFGGSHKAFLDGWTARSRHDWTVLGLRPSKWKWRMRHAAVTFSDDVAARVANGESWDLVFCSDMLNLAEFRGLCPPAIAALSSVVYFHENQITYPMRVEAERDHHFGFTNMTTALAATRVWFNSAFNRDSFLDALPTFLRKMPDYRPLDAIDRIRAKSKVHPPGIDPPPADVARIRAQRAAARRAALGGATDATAAATAPLRILWAARWEHDKDPDAFFDAIGRLKTAGNPFRLSVLGERFAESPRIFDVAEREFAEHIDHWGYAESRDAYWRVLANADVLVSTAQHEFFGLSVVEAIAAGVYPLLPRRLSYPELLTGDEFFYEGGPRELAERLAALAERAAIGALWIGEADHTSNQAGRFQWEPLTRVMDDELDVMRVNAT
jgi:glycosyltransferase involved in cell wall biosynthesis